MVPAQNRPRRSHFPSFIRMVRSSAPTSTRSACEPSVPSARNPSAAAKISPPLALTATAPTSIPTSIHRSCPVEGSNRCTADPVMSTQTSVSVPGSQIGPSPTSARVRTTSSGSIVHIPVPWLSARAHFMPAAGLPIPLPAVGSSAPPVGHPSVYSAPDHPRTHHGSRL